MQTLKKIGRFIVNLDVYLGCVLLAALILLTFVGVFRRYLFSAPIVWLEEVQLFLFLWVAFLGGCAAFRRGGHVAIEVFVDRFPPKLKMATEIFVAALVVALLGYLAKQGFDYLQILISAERHTSILAIPYSFIYGILPWASIVMMLNQIYAIIDRWFISRSGYGEKTGGAE